MGILDLFRRKSDPQETRSSGSGFTTQIIAARESYIRGAHGVAELTATSQSCISLWEGAFALADVQGTDLLTRRDMALIARSAALRGEYVALITERGLVPAVDWDLRTRDGIPTAYRLTLADAGGGRAVTALAAEVLHLRIGADAAAPYIGSAPLRRASLTAGLLQTIEATLAEVYENAPIGSAIVPMPEMQEADMERTARGFRGSRGRVLIRESVNVSAAGGPAPVQDWAPRDLSPDLERAMITQNLAAARDAICGVFGVLPALLNPATTGPVVREAQRHLATWAVQPVAALLAEEASAKLGSEVFIDCLRPVQAYDVGGRARALSTIIEAFARAKELQLSPEEINTALTLVNWGENDGAA